MTRLHDAKHESGHALISYVAGNREGFSKMSLKTSGDKDYENSSAAGICVYDSLAPLHHIVLMAVAGVAGTRLDSEEPGEFFDSDGKPEPRASGDYKVIREAFKETQVNLTEEQFRDYVNDCLRTAWNFLRDNREVHSQLTQRLLSKHRLTNEEVQDLARRIKEIFVPYEHPKYPDRVYAKRAA